MSYDLYVAKPRDGDVPTRLRLLAGKTDSTNAARDFIKLMHDGKGYRKFIKEQRTTMGQLSLLSPKPVLSLLPPGSWFLQFTFTLAKPWISKDDEIFYVAESVNPVRKDKVFKVPMMSASGWKGVLRWTAMHTRLAQWSAKLSPEAFAVERFVQTLLFGDEAGEEPGGRKNFAAYVDSLNHDARSRSEYERLLRTYYGVKEDDPLPHHSGRLHFYPTFFDQIDVEVINPHSRATKAGTHPIYLESVPAGASGAFTLLYAAFDRIGKDESETCQQALKDLYLVAEGLQAMFTVYGFGAKTSSGFGVAEEMVENGTLVLNLPDIVFPQAETSQVQKPDDAYSKYLDEDGKVRSVFEGNGEGGLMSNREYKNEGQQCGGGSLSEFKAFRQWYSKHGEQWQGVLKAQSHEKTLPSFPFEKIEQINEALTKMGVEP